MSKLHVIDLVPFLIERGVAKSNAEAKRLIKQGLISIRNNGEFKKCFSPHIVYREENGKPEIKIQRDTLRGINEAPVS